MIFDFWVYWFCYKENNKENFGVLNMLCVIMLIVYCD